MISIVIFIVYTQNALSFGMLYEQYLNLIVVYSPYI